MRWYVLFAMIIVVVAFLFLGYVYQGAESRDCWAAISNAPEFEEMDDPLIIEQPAFDPSRVDSRPLLEWEVNQSAAVIRLDCPKLDLENNGYLLELRPDYASVMSRDNVLPSANLIDGAAKQFDDGLYAALDLACFNGTLDQNVPSAVDFIVSVFGRLPKSSPARPFLGAALQLAGRTPDLTAAEKDVQKQMILDFEQCAYKSKPISFYTWKPELEKTWKFFRFLQETFPDYGLLQIPKDIAVGIGSEPNLTQHYNDILGFYGHLTNPQYCLPVTALLENTDNLRALQKKYGVDKPVIAVFPPSTSPETMLMDHLFSWAVFDEPDIMTALIKRIRSGEIDVKPKPEDGWYQYQIYALEALLRPGKNPESERLSLTAQYKRRLTDAFKVMFTKRRETHIRQLPIPQAGFGNARTYPTGISPRLRLEPCPAVYLRTARAYAFLQNFLHATLRSETLKTLRPLKEDGYRGMNLEDALEDMRLRTYGFYLIACEDIGMAPEFLQDEPVDESTAKQTALSWLENLDTNPDLACDTRVAVPLFVSPVANTVRLWITLGVRLTKLDASYLWPPKIRPLKTNQPWEEVDSASLAPSHMFIPVEEFIEIEIDADKIPNRAELRTLCDKYQTKEEIAAALRVYEQSVKTR